MSSEGRLRSGDPPATGGFGPSRSQVLAETDGPHGTTDPADTDRPTAALPSLADDCYLLRPDAEGPRARREATRTALATLALDTALSAGGDAVWIDTQGYVATHALARLAPSDRALDRVRVARAFTLHQHHALVTGVARWLREGEPGPFGGPATDRPAILVVPAADATYRAGEPTETRSERLFARTVAQLRGVARSVGIPVVTTLADPSGLGETLAAGATGIDVAATRFGPRFDCPALSFETVAYDDGATTQTTFAFWREILRSRHGIAEPSGPRVGVEG